MICARCKVEIDPDTVPSPPPDPLLCLDCLHEHDGEILVIHDGEAQDVIPADEREL